MRIRGKLLICLLAVLLPLVCVSLFTINLLEKQLIERTESSLSNTLRLEAARINEILADYAQDARNLASSTHVQEFVTACNAYRQAIVLGEDTSHLLSTSVGGLDDFAIIDRTSEWPLQQLALTLQRKAGITGSNVVEIRILDAQGQTLGETLGYSWQPADATQLKQSMQSVKTTFGDAFINDEGKQRLGITAPVISENGDVVGALMLETRLKPITNLTAQLEGIGESNEAHLAQPTLDGDAQFITALRFDRQAAFSRIVPATDNQAVNQSLSSLRERIIRAPDYRGVESILAIQTLPATGWGLTVKMDASEAFAPVLKLQSAHIFTTIILLIFFVSCYLFYLVPIAQRLKRTAAAAHKIMNGDLTTRVDDSEHDEVGNLARTIDKLACDLESDQKMRTEVEARLRHQALHDELTGLLNRKYANKVIKQLNEDRQNNHSVMFLDLNGFKDVNDFYGHAAGDEVLVTVAKRLTTVIDDGATLARWGGDEFVVILPNYQEKEAGDLALKVHSAFVDPIATQHGVHNVSCSIGLATSSTNKSLDEVLMEADIQMYEQKKRRQQSRGIGSTATRTVERALNEDRVEVWYQPIVNHSRPGSFELAGAEALVRLRSREGGIILPEEFIQSIDTHDVGSDLDRRVLSKALHSLSRWSTSGIVRDNFQLSLNITTKSLNDPAFCAILNNQLQTAAVRPNQIIIELPHFTSIDPLLLSHLRLLGVTVALEQLGPDPTSLIQTTRLQPSLAKIHRCWLGDAIVAPHMVSICRELNLNIIVEGVETRDQMIELHTLGIQNFQGYLFDSPLRAVDFVSRWGESSMEGLGERLNRTVALRLAG